MYNPNEEIQIIGIDYGENVTWQEKLIIEERITKLNEKLELKNRYIEMSKENIKLKQELLDYQYMRLDKVKE